MSDLSDKEPSKVYSKTAITFSIVQSGEMLFCEIISMATLMAAEFLLGIPYRQYLSNGRVKMDSDFGISDYRVNIPSERMNVLKIVISEIELKFNEFLCCVMRGLCSYI
jgi:hypothetical protein